MLCVCECVERFFVSVACFLICPGPFTFLVTASCGGIMTVMTMNLIVLIL